MTPPKVTQWGDFYWEVPGDRGFPGRVELDPEDGDISLLGIPNPLPFGLALCVADAIRAALDYYEEHYK